MIWSGRHRPHHRNTRELGTAALGNVSRCGGREGRMRWNMGVDYQQRWSARDSVAGFGHGLCDAWAAEYSAETGLDADDLVVIDPGNGFSYLFDLAGTLRGVSCSRAPRVVGVWGLSQPGAPGRDHNRMRGHPQPGRSGDDRGHLISCAAGGGYDINLVPMDAALNRGWSAEGSRFRALERKATATPGTLFFIRAVYQDSTDRPSRARCLASKTRRASSSCPMRR